MLTITVFLLSFNNETPIPTREVDIPSEEVAKIHPGRFTEEARGSLLELVFYYGQNDFQPKPIRSVSCGDVIKLPDGSLHKVLGVGFEALPLDTDINTLPRGSRATLC